MFAALNSFQTGGAMPVYVSEVFSTTLYTGNGSTQTITNNIDVANKGGLIWTKARSGTFSTADHLLQDSARGFGDSTGLASNTTSAQFSYSGLIQSVSSTGFTTGSNPYSNASSTNYVAWAFRKQPKFFDIVTYTGNGTSSRAITHNLQSTPGCIIVRNYTNVDNFYVYHRSLNDGVNPELWYNLLNSDEIEKNTSSVWGGTPPTSTNFSVGPTSTNDNGLAYIAYVFAHNAGGFGLTGGNNAISCGFYTGNGSTTGPVVTLGYQPQWLLIKRGNSGNGNWLMLDVARGFSASTDNDLYANRSNAEGTTLDLAEPQSTGFQIKSSSLLVNGNTDRYIYMAINAS